MTKERKCEECKIPTKIWHIRDKKLCRKCADEYDRRNPVLMGPWWGRFG